MIKTQFWKLNIRNKMVNNDAQRYVRSLRVDNFRSKNHDVVNTPRSMSTNSTHEESLLNIKLSDIPSVKSGHDNNLNTALLSSRSTTPQSISIKRGRIYQEEGSPRNKQRFFKEQMLLLADMISSNPFYYFNLFIPLSVLSVLFNENNRLSIFIFSFLGLLPLAALLGDLTEELALTTGEIIGGLINATLGNAVEMILTIQALRAGYFKIVTAQLIGSVFSNLLLVLGCAFFFGGVKHNVQTFNIDRAQVNTSMLIVGVITIVMTNTIRHFDQVSGDNILLMHRIVSYALLVVYSLYIYYELFFVEQNANSPSSSVITITSIKNIESKDVDHLEVIEEEEDSGTQLELKFNLFCLITLTTVISIISQFMVDSISDVLKLTNMSKSFLGVILFPIVGNAAEHITAVTCAMRNKPELTMGVAVGSSTQILTFMVPFSVICAQLMGIAFTFRSSSSPSTASSSLRANNDDATIFVSNQFKAPNLNTPTDLKQLWEEIDRELFNYMEQQVPLPMNHPGGEAFDHHLKGVQAVLRYFGAPDYLTKAGLFHSVYGTQAFHSALLSLSERRTLQKLIGNKAEQLAFWFCMVDRWTLDQTVMDWNKPLDDDIKITLRSRPELGRFEITLQKKEWLDLVELTIADWLEQVEGASLKPNDLWLWKIGEAYSYRRLAIAKMVSVLEAERPSGRSHPSREMLAAVMGTEDNSTRCLVQLQTPPMSEAAAYALEALRANGEDILLDRSPQPHKSLSCLN